MRVPKPVLKYIGDVTGARVRSLTPAHGALIRPGRKADVLTEARVARTMSRLATAFAVATGVGVGKSKHKQEKEQDMNKYAAVLAKIAEMRVERMEKAAASLTAMKALSRVPTPLLRGATKVRRGYDAAAPVVREGTRDIGNRLREFLGQLSGSRVRGQERLMDSILNRQILQAQRGREGSQTLTDMFARARGVAGQEAARTTAARLGAGTGVGVGLMLGGRGGEKPAHVLDQLAETQPEYVAGLLDGLEKAAAKVPFTGVLKRTVAPALARAGRKADSEIGKYIRNLTGSRAKRLKGLKNTRGSRVRGQHIARYEEPYLSGIPENLSGYPDAKLNQADALRGKTEQSIGRMFGKATDAADQAEVARDRTRLATGTAAGAGVLAALVSRLRGRGEDKQ